MGVWISMSVWTPKIDQIIVLVLLAGFRFPSRIFEFRYCVTSFEFDSPMLINWFILYFFNSAVNQLNFCSNKGSIFGTFFIVFIEVFNYFLIPFSVYNHLHIGCFGTHNLLHQEFRRLFLNLISTQGILERLWNKSVISFRRISGPIWIF